jgi:hypothetical protein
MPDGMQKLGPRPGKKPMAGDAIVAAAAILFHLKAIA